MLPKIEEELLVFRMVGLVRIYIEPREGLPEGFLPEPYCPFVDVKSKMFYSIRKMMKSQGYDVICVPI